MTSEIQKEPAGQASVHDRDADVADIFQTMRKALGLSPSALAQKLQTETSVIVALERGDLSRLPEWDETTRIVNDYAGLLQLDCRPILRRIAVRKENNEESAPDAGSVTAKSASSLSTGIIVAIAIVSVLVLALVAALALAVMQWRGPVEDATPKPDSEFAAPAPRVRTTPSGQAEGPITIRRVPLPQAVEAPPSKDGVDQSPGNSDKNATTSQ